MDRVAIVGTPGGGKSTLADELARSLGLVRVELDALYHLPGWEETPVPEFRAKVAEAALDLDERTIAQIRVEPRGYRADSDLPDEKVQIVNKANGARLITYVIEGAAGSGSICVNGAAARHVQRGDELLVIAYGQFTEEEARRHRARVAFLSPENRVVELND